MTEQVAVEANADTPDHEILSTETTTDTKTLVDLKSTISVSAVALMSITIYMLVAWYGLGAETPSWLKFVQMLKAFIEGAAVGALALVTGTIALSIIVNRNTTVLNNIAQFVTSPPLVISQEQTTDFRTVFVKEVQALTTRKEKIEGETARLKSERSGLEADIRQLKGIRDGFEKSLDANRKLANQYDIYKSGRR